jgi:epoxyqueuosine reductase
MKGHRPLQYKVEEAGMFLKDAATLAGLGIIGKNNLLITPEFEPLQQERRKPM